MIDKLREMLNDDIRRGASMQSIARRSGLSTTAIRNILKGGSMYVYTAEEILKPYHKHLEIVDD